MKLTTGSLAEGLEWDSEFWRMPVGKAARSEGISEWANEHAEGCLFLLIPAKDQADIHRSEQHGARVMDVRVELTRTYLDESHDPRAVHDIGTIRMNEIGGMAHLARTAFRGLTRFYADPNFPTEKVDDLYELWFMQMLDRDYIIVARDDNFAPVGFVTVTRDERGAHIGLIAVKAEERGRGWGVRLTNAACHYAAEVGEKRISVVTQGCNIAAQHTFQDCGFRTCDVSVWLHKWFREDQ